MYVYFINAFQVEDSNTVWSQSVGSSQCGTKSPVQRILLNNTSKNGSAHGSIRKSSKTNSLQSSEKDESSTELPKVHASPKKPNALKEKELLGV